ncbi:MAG: sulfurtransferase [Alphaproteobacteria bacterium]|nr:sulfurtransferase [Alphaproteobacteria bacterium]
MTDGQGFAISVDELAARRRAGEAIVLIDVREPWEREICHLPDSRAIPLASLSEHLDALPHDGMLVIHCHHGARSAQAVQWLRANGFANAVNLEGGIDAWARRIDPAMGTY